MLEKGESQAKEDDNSKELYWRSKTRDTELEKKRKLSKKKKLKKSKLREIKSWWWKKEGEEEEVRDEEEYKGREKIDWKKKGKKWMLGS